MSRISTAISAGESVTLHSGWMIATMILWIVVCSAPIIWIIFKFRRRAGATFPSKHQKMFTPDDYEIPPVPSLTPGQRGVVAIVDPKNARSGHTTFCFQDHLGTFSFADKSPGITLTSEEENWPIVFTPVEGAFIDGCQEVTNVWSVQLGTIQDVVLKRHPDGEYYLLDIEMGQYIIPKETSSIEKPRSGRYIEFAPTAEERDGRIVLAYLANRTY